MDILRELPWAGAGAGAAINRVDICLKINNHETLLRLNQWAADVVRPPPHPSQITEVYLKVQGRGMPAELVAPFLAVLLESDKIKVIELEFERDFGNGRLLHADVGPALNQTSRSGLERLVLTGASIHGHELKRLTDMLPLRLGPWDPATHITLQRLRLLNGSWAAALDCLRTRVDDSSGIRNPRDAECVDMDGIKYGRIFGGYRPGAFGRAEQKTIGSADLYIQIRDPSALNPLRIRRSAVVSSRNWDWNRLCGTGVVAAPFCLLPLRIHSFLYVNRALENTIASDIFRSLFRRVALGLFYRALIARSYYEGKIGGKGGWGYCR